MSKIEWTDETWNPIVGCSVVSPGCTNCYAMRMAGRLEAMSVAHEGRTGGDPGSLFYYRDLTRDSRAGAVWTGKIKLAPEYVLTKPLRWKKPRMVFVNSMGDLFHEDIPDEWIDKVFAVMALTPQHTYQVLTKRPERMRECVGATDAHDRMLEAARLLTQNMDERLRDRPLCLWPLPNVWLGVSCEDQARADERIPPLLETPAALRFVSAEPLLGRVCLKRWIGEAICASTYVAPGERFERCDLTGAPCEGLDWVIVGSESGPGARPCNIDWVRSLRDQCSSANVPFFWKQHVVSGRKISTPELDGKKWAELPI